MTFKIITQVAIDVGKKKAKSREVCTEQLGMRRIIKGICEKQKFRKLF